MKTFYIKCTHLFKTKEAALAAGISPWDMWEVQRDDSADTTTISPVQVGPVVDPVVPPTEEEPINPPWRESKRRARRKK